MGDASTMSYMRIGVNVSLVTMGEACMSPVSAYVFTDAGMAYRQFTNVGVVVGLLSATPSFRRSSLRPLELMNGPWT